MYSKGKQQQMQQPPQQMAPPQQSAEFASKDKLAQFVYEYLVHMGAKNSAQTFLSEIRYDKQIGVGEAPGFLTSWWSVFWDLYCAATPGVREQFEPSNEAKAFHDYTNGMMGQQQAPPHPPPPLGPPPPDPSQMQPSGQMMNPQNSFFPGPNPQNPMMNSGQPQFQRFHSGGQRPMRMPSNIEFNPNNPSPMTPDQTRVPGMSPLSRLTPPGNRMPPGMQQGPQPPPPQQQAPMAFNGQAPPQQPPQQRNQQPPAPPMTPQQQPGAQPPPPQQQAPPQQPPSQAPTPGTPMSPSMSSFQQQQRWNAQQQQQHQQAAAAAAAAAQQQQNMQQAQQQAHNMNFTSASPPITFANVQMSGHPGTPGIISSPQDANGDINFNNIMKNVPSGMQFHEQNMAHMVSINPEVTHHTHLNNEMIDSMKNSPMQGGVRHPDDHSGTGSMNDLNSYNHFGDGSVNLF